MSSWTPALPAGRPAVREPDGVSPPTSCAHCGLALGVHWRAEDGPFCCRGCRLVYQLIHEEGLGRYYDLRRLPTAPPAELRADSLNWLDSVLEQAPAVPGSTAKRLQLDIQGVHCAACIWLLEKLFERHAGGRYLRINPAVGGVDMLWDSSRSELKSYLREVESFGYRFGPRRKASPRRSRALLIHIGICAAASMNVMTYSLAYYLGLAPDEATLFALLGKLSVGWAALALLVGGYPFIVSAWRGLGRGIAHLDLPIALGMVLAFSGSTWAYIDQGPEGAYFDTITIFITLMLVGRWLQERVVERNRNALLASAGIADLFTRRFDRDEPKIPKAIPVSEIVAQDELWIAPGDLVPVASTLRRQAASISLDWITGEAAAVEVAPGAVVPAGAFNAGARGFRAVANEEFSSSRLGELIRGDGETDSRAKVSSIEGWWNRVASIYVLLVFAMAAIGFAVGWQVGLQRAIETSVAILVVTCPCALGLGLPLGREMAHARLRRLGVLLRDDGFLDRAQQLRKVIFDKTGTLTRGRLRVSKASLEALDNLDAEHRQVLLAMVARSSHPVSRSLAEALESRVMTSSPAVGTDMPKADDLEEITGMGLRFCRGAEEYRLGRAEFVLSGPNTISGPFDRGLSDRGAESFPGAFFGLDGELLIALELEEDLKPDAETEIRALESMGLSVYLFSGDTDPKVSRIAEQLSLPSDRARGDLTPEQKAREVSSLDRDDTLMVGDGLNDSLSFDAAYCKATPAVDRAILPQKADFYFLGDGVGAVRQAIEMARHLHRVQAGNLIFAAVYNFVALALCFAGVVTPVVAAILMPLSSVTVVAMTSHRLGKGSLGWTS